MTPSGANGSGDGGGVLSSRPERLWPDAVLHHGIRLLLLVGLAALVTVLFPPARRTAVTRYEPGTVADETVQAEVPFGVPKSEQELRRDRAEAAASVPATFEHRPAAADSMEARLGRFFDTLGDTARASGSAGIRRMLSRVGIAATADQLSLLADSTVRMRMEETALRVARDLVPRGVIDASQAQDITTDRVTVRQLNGRERSVPTDSLLIGREFLDRAMGFLAPAPPDVEDLFRLILIRFVEPTYVLDPVATEADKEAARRSVPETKENILAGQVIVRQGDPIGQREVQRLNAYAQELQSRGMLQASGFDLAPLAGHALLNLLLFAVFGFLLYFFRPEVYGNVRWVVLQALLVAAYFGAAALIAGRGWSPELLPIAFVTLSVAVLWDGRMALVLALALGALTGALPPFSDYQIPAVTLLGGAAAALSVRVIRRRAQTWGIVAVIAATYTLALVAFALIRGWQPGHVLVDLAWAVGNGTVSAILAMGFVPVFEWFTGITTDQTLLEWADPNRPLLRRLALEAPGTYAHTINVANIAEAAAGAIGANGLLCRVGIYYHDVGKILKPQYFVENQPGGRNPHDKLKPDTSASIVREHVVEGLRLAREERVPKVIQAFISEHHGTQKIGFFYEKAMEEGEGKPDPQHFRYPGPSPRSRETAIAMLADSVESATRALQDPTPERTRDLVHNIVQGKIEAGQLDDAPLTLKEIATLEEQFTKILTGMYHHRIDYPQTRHLTESGGGPADGPGGGEGTEKEGGEEAAEGPKASGGGTSAGRSDGAPDGARGPREPAPPASGRER